LGLWLTACAVNAFASGPFYRIIDGPNPGPRQATIDRYIYGAEVLYTGDAHPDRGPIQVQGTVWHSNLAEAKYYVGTHNPVIEQRGILALIESNKWEEAKLLMAHIPGAFPKTENLAEIIREIRLGKELSASETLKLISHELRVRYPEGFFLKPVSGFSSDGTFPSERSDFAAVYEAYLRDVKPVIERRLIETAGDADTVHLELKRTPNYEGRVFEELLTHAENVIVQTKLDPAIGAILHTPQGPKPLIIEYRVHVVEGTVLQGATETRWEDTRGVSSEAYTQVEAFAQRMVSRLPSEMRGMCFGMDVMQTKDGRFMIIELNAGGESQYLYPDTDLWVANLLAKRFRGQTELLAQFENFSNQPTLQAKEAALAKLLKLDEIKALAAEVSPITELLTHAKEVLLEDLRALPNHSNAMDVMMSLKRFKLESYLTISEIEQLGNMLHTSVSGSAPVRLQTLTEQLGLQEGEILFVGSQGQLHLVNGLAYDDFSVRDALLAELRGKLGSKFSPSKARAEARRLVDRSVATRAELVARRFARENLAKTLVTQGESRLYFSGTRASLVRYLLEGLLRH
jgi:hypothetical protein